MGKRIRGHVYPKFLIRNFCDCEGKGNLVWAYNKRKKSIYPVSPGNVLTKSNVYIADLGRILTFLDRVYPGFLPPTREYCEGDLPAELFRLDYESELAKLEGEAKDVLEKLLDLARNSIPRFNMHKDSEFISIKRTGGEYMGEFFLTEKESIHLVQFLTSLAARVKVDYEKRASEICAEFMGEWILEFPDLSKDWADFKRAAQPVETLARGKTPALFSKKGIAIMVIKNPKKSFVIGDRPFVGCNGYENLLEAKAELYVAISPRVAVGLLGNEGVGSEVRVFCVNNNSHGNRFIRSFNEQVFRNSNTVVARSRKLLESLAG